MTLLQDGSKEKRVRKAYNKAMKQVDFLLREVSREILLWEADKKDYLFVDYYASVCIETYSDMQHARGVIISLREAKALSLPVLVGPTKADCITCLIKQISDCYYWVENYNIHHTEESFSYLQKHIYTLYCLIRMIEKVFPPRSDIPK